MELADILDALLETLSSAILTESECDFAEPALDEAETCLRTESLFEVFVWLDRMLEASRKSSTFLLRTSKSGSSGAASVVGVGETARFPSTGPALRLPAMYVSIFLPHRKTI